MYWILLPSANILSKTENSETVSVEVLLNIRVSQFGFFWETHASINLNAINMSKLHYFTNKFK